MKSHTSEGVSFFEQTEAKLRAFAAQASARSARKQAAVFEDFGETLGKLAVHPILKTDLHFKMLMSRLAGAEDMEVFFDRAAQLDAYVRGLAHAYGATPVAESNATRPPQMPDHMRELDETELTRTRLNMR